MWVTWFECAGSKRMCGLWGRCICNGNTRNGSRLGREAAEREFREGLFAPPPLIELNLCNKIMGGQASSIACPSLCAECKCMAAAACQHFPACMYVMQAAVWVAYSV